MQIKIKLQNTRQQPSFLQIKELSSSWFLKTLQVLKGARSWSCLHHCWLSWWFTDWSSRLSEPLTHFDGNCIVHRSLFPRKEEIVESLSHISRNRSFGVFHSHLLSHFLYHLHFSRLVLLNWESISGRKTPQTVSGNWNYTKSAENSTENIRMLFWTEKIILSNKLRGKLNK